MYKPKNASKKFLITVVAGISLVIIGSLYIEFLLSRRYINYRAQSLIINNINNHKIEINEELESFETLSMNVSTLIASVGMDHSQLDELQRLIFSISPNIRGIGIVREIKNNPDPELYSSYYFKEKDSLLIRFRELPYEISEYTQNATEIQPVCLSGNINDTLLGMNTNYITEDQNTRIYFSIDYDPVFIFENLNNLTELEEVRYLIISDTGQLMYYNNSIPENISIETFAGNESDDSYLKLKKYIQNNDEEYISSGDFNGKESVYIFRLECLDWNCFILLPTEYTDAILFKHFILVTLISLLAILFALVLILYFSRSITLPLNLLFKGIKQLEYGNLHSTFKHNESNDEFEEISRSFEKIQAKMEHYAKGFKNSLEEKRAMEHDLRTANKIQVSMLPDQFHTLTDFPLIDLFTRLVPAKGIAGDFFDYCFLDNNRFFFIVGDVSGKGTPAALFMVRMLTLLRTGKMRSQPLKTIFTEISDSLLDNNDEGIFITAIAGILDYTSGSLTLCDAGHNPPILSNKSRTFHYFDVIKNVPLGVMKGVEYNESSFQLYPGDTLFLYTDGLPEAFNRAGEMFGSDKIIESLKGQQNKELVTIFKNLRNDFLEFVGNARQTDDITVFILRYMGEKN